MTTRYPWFDAALERVSHSVREGRLPHALLVVIPAGWGRMEFLALLAQEILGLPAPPSLLDQLAHPDFRFVRSFNDDGEPSKIIQIDAIRALGDFATQRPVNAPRKLAILPQAHNIHPSAANALLKTLEEPASDCCLVLESAQPAQLLATIRSRCQRLPMRFARSQALAWLERQADVDAVPVLDLVGGGPLDAVRVRVTPDCDIRIVLDRLENDTIRTTELDRLARYEGLLLLLGQWYRVALARLGGQVASPRRGRLLEFADELLVCQHQIAAVKGVNTRLLLDRLLYLWEQACVA